MRLRSGEVCCIFEWVEGCMKARMGSQTNVRASLKIAQLLKNKQQNAVFSGVCDQYAAYS